MMGNERALIEQLEPRILLSASPLPECSDVAVEVDARQNDVETQEQIISEIAFVDTSVENFEDLITGLDTNIEVVLIDSEENGIDKISEVLANREGISALHIISHGSSSEVFLGNILLSNESIDLYNSQLADWQSSLTDSADILIYGCNVGKNVELIQTLAEKTDADVAASDDVTGVGGDDDLEVKHGEIYEQAIIDQNSYQKAGVSLAANDAVTNEINFNTMYGTDYVINAEAAIKQAFEDASDGDTIVFDERNFTFVLTSEIKLTNKVVHLRADNVEVTFDGNNDADPEGGTRLLNYDLQTLSDVLIQGIKFQNGYSANEGGAVRFKNSNLTLVDVTVKNSSAGNEGGGLYHNTGSLTVQNSTFSDNKLVSNANQVHTRGGGLFTVNSSSVSITDSNFSRNNLESYKKDAHSQGGGLFIDSVDEVTFSTNSLSENKLLTKGYKADTQGGAVYIKSTERITFDSNTISKNSTESLRDISQGSGAYLYTEHEKSVSNNIFKENTGVSNNNNYGGGLFLSGSGSNKVSENTFESNIITSRTKSAKGGGLSIASGGAKNISENTVRNNSVEAKEENAYGGGIYVTGTSDLIFKENKVTENSANSNEMHVFGAGVVINGDGENTLTDNVISKNSSNAQNSAYGGGLYLNSSGTKTLTGNVITSNTLTAVNNAFGGGVNFNKSSDTKLLTNNTISDNSLNSGSSSYGGGVYANGNGALQLLYNSILENSLTGTTLHGSGLWSKEANVEFRGNIIYLNTGGNSQYHDQKNIVESGSHNIIGGSFRLTDLADKLDASSYSSLADLGLTQVTENGYVKYYQLSSDSDLKEAGQVSADAATSEDQLGNAIDNGTRDIGALEYINVAPEVDFEFSTTDYRTYNFNADASDSDGSIASYSWNFGDGSSSFSSPSFTFSSGGSYTVKLTVTDNSGATSTILKTVTVPYVPVIDDFNLLSSEVDENTSASFTLIFSDSDTTDTHTVDVDWGDGISTEVAVVSGAAFKHIYVDDGNYTISVALTDSFGVSASSSAAITVNNLAPQTSDAGITINEDGSYVFSNNDFAFSDVPADSFAGVMISSLPDNGSLFYDGVLIDLSSGDFFAEYPSLLSYAPAENDNADTFFEFKVSDGQDLSEAATMGIRISPVADLPVISVPDVYGTAGESVDFIISADAGAPGETLVLFVNNLPAGTALSAGEQVGISWRLTQDQLSGLKINLGNDGSFTPDVTAVSIDGDSIAEENVSFSLKIDTVFITPAIQVQLDAEGDTPESVNLLQGSQTISYQANSLNFFSTGSRLQFNNISLSEDALSVIATLFNDNIEVDIEVADDGVLEVENNPQVYDLSILNTEEQQFIKDLIFGVEVTEGVNEFINEESEEEEEESLSFISDDIALSETLSSQEEVYVLKQSDLDSRLSLEDILLGEFDCFRS